MRKQRNEGGFTLVELLVVIAIIGILVSLLVPAVSSALTRAKIAKCQTNLRGLGQALTLYQGKFGKNIYMPDKTGQALWLHLINMPDRDNAIVGRHHRHQPQLSRAQVPHL
jgi:prepilin-type N-terminal cleavage/methylation domain-containing protein